MKTLTHKIILLAIATLTAVSCTTLLEKLPYQEYTDEEVLNSADGLQALLNGTYDVVKSRYYYGALIYQYDVAKGCDFFVRDVGGGTSMTSEASYSASSTSSGSGPYAWTTIYSVITNANIILDHVDSLAGDVETLRRIKGEALALRGLAYFDLMRLFAYPPHFSILNQDVPGYEQLTLGVPIMKDSDMSLHPENYTIRRVGADTVYNYILEQFTKAKSFLEGKKDSEGYINAATASALRMRVLLYLERWSDVIAEGEEWMAKYGDNYSMISYDSYQYNYYKPFNSESVWELEYTEANSLGSNSLNHWVRKPTDDDPQSATYGDVVMNTGYARVGFMYGNPNNGLPFLQAYPNDIRLVWLCKLGIQEHPEYIGCRKYVGSPFHSTHNIPIIRIPEVYLTMAEAYYHVSDFVNAGKYASLVSQSRRKADISGSDINSIYGERRREYMLEGQNYFDMFRRGTNIRNRQYIELSDNGSITFGSITSQHYRTVYPIPLKEMNANPAIRNQQNPGYAAWVAGGEE